MSEENLFEMLQRLNTQANKSQAFQEILSLITEIELSGDAGAQTIDQLSFRVGDSVITMNQDDIILMSKWGSIRLREIITLLKYVSFLREQKAGSLPSFLQ